MRFALNHMADPKLDFTAFARLARDLGVNEVEIRNDLPGVPMQDGTPPAAIREAAAAAGVRILTINALQRFEDWNDTRAAEAETLAAYAQACGAEALVMCPTNDRSDRRSEAERADGLRRALVALRTVLKRHGVRGFVEPLGFEECALRLKRTAVDAIDATASGDVLFVLHDTFHHFLAGETEFFAQRTGLVHISGVTDRSVAHADIRDSHRVLVDADDLMDNVGQIRALLRDGYSGPFSFEPFSKEVHSLPDVAAALRTSISVVQKGVAA